MSFEFNMDVLDIIDLLITNELYQLCQRAVSSTSERLANSATFTVQSSSRNTLRRL